MDTDATYFFSPAREERAAAAKAAHPTARDAHLDMANRYEEFASAIDARARALGLHLVS
jgi:hypothetical protein